MNTWHDASLRETVRALHHLPVGEWVPQLEDAVANGVAQQLLALPDELDPIQWLEANEAGLAAHFLLWSGLAYLKASLLGAKHRREAQQEAPQDPWFGDLLDLSAAEIDHLFQPIARTSGMDVPAEALETVFRNIQALYQHRQAASQESLNGDLFPLMRHLLELPIAANPIDSVQTTYLHDAAVQLLDHILSALRLPPPLWSERPVQTYKPRTALTINGVSLRVSHLALLRTGFTLRLTARVPRKVVRRLPGFSYIAWEGVEQVIDNLGNQYVIEYRLPVGRGLSWWFDQAIRLLCYPPLRPTVSDIVVHGSEANLLIMGITQGVNPRMERLQEIPLGSFDLPVNLPKR